MKGIIKNLIAMLLIPAFIGTAFAQVPEDPNQAPPPGLTEDTETPVEATKAVEAAESGSSFSFAPYLMFKPIGVDKLIGSHYAYTSIEPGIDFSADFLTGTKRKLNLSLGYLFIYQQYWDDNYERYFEHELIPSLSHDITTKLSVNLNMVVYFMHYYSTANQSSNEYAFEGNPALTYKLNDKASFGLGVYYLFYYDPNNIRTFDQVDHITNPPTEPGDMGRGTTSFYDASQYGANPYYPQLSSITPEPEGEMFRGMILGPTMKASYKATPTTTSTFIWHYYGWTPSNNDEAEYTGHQWYFQLGQKFGKGGSIKAEYRLRRRAFSYAYTPSGRNKIDYRHRLQATVVQTINDYLSLEAWYRIDHSRANTADPSNMHWFYFGTKFSF